VISMGTHHILSVEAVINDALAPLNCGSGPLPRGQPPAHHASGVDMHPLDRHRMPARIEVITPEIPRRGLSTVTAALRFGRVCAVIGPLPTVTAPQDRRLSIPTLVMSVGACSLNDECAGRDVRPGAQR
jgi:hypothetical protein